MPEVIEAGFTHGMDGQFGPVRDRRGFEAGGPADVLAPCSVLAELTGQARDRMGELSDDELVGIMLAARRVASWQTALELEAVNELAARRMAEPIGSGPQPGERAAAELAVALTLTGRAAEGLMSLALGIERLAPVRDALARGEIDLGRAKVLADELAGLDTQAAFCIATAMMISAAGLTSGQLRDRLRRKVLAVDPDAIRRRQTDARADTRVQAWNESSGNAALAGRELPPAEMLAADRHISALARALKAAGVPGTMHQLRARVFLALLSGRDPATILDYQARQADDDPDAATEASPDAATDRSAAQHNRPDQTDGTGRHGTLQWPSGPRGSVNLTVPLSAWLGLTDRPGQVAGFGPADAWTCRDIAASLAQAKGVRYCMTVTSPDGQPVGHACSHTAPPGPAPPEPNAVAVWLSQLKVTWLNRGEDCSHDLETAGYRPGGRLAHFVRLLNPTCTAPGCRRPAVGCDLDHLQPYDQGGLTCSCNLHPCCRRHHRLKQQPGWRVEMPRTGVLLWRMPHGRSYLGMADPYPV